MGDDDIHHCLLGEVPSNYLMVDTSMKDNVLDIMEARQGYNAPAMHYDNRVCYAALVSDGITLGYDSNTLPPHSVTMSLAEAHSPHTL